MSAPGYNTNQVPQMSITPNHAVPPADPHASSGEGRKVHPELQRVIREMPDAVERLRYVGQKTEAAATEVLNLVDEAKAGCDEREARSVELSQSLERLLGSPDLDLSRARVMMSLCVRQLAETAAFAQRQDAVLTRIMLAQDFQDLTGQVIRKVCDILVTAEEHLLHVQADGVVEAQATSAAAAPPAEQARELVGVQVPDKALQQTDVDDLLAELGF